MNDVDMFLKSSEFAADEMDKLLKKYKQCKTEYAKKQLLPQITAIQNKVIFESNILQRLMINGGLE